MSVRCKIIREPIVDAVSEVPSPDPMREIVEHLERCNECRRFKVALEHDDRMLVEFAARAEQAVARIRSVRWPGSGRRDHDERL